MKMNVETNSVTLSFAKRHIENRLFQNKLPIWAIRASIYPFQSDFTVIAKAIQVILYPCKANTR